MSKTYIVSVKEIHIQQYEIEADSESEALELVTNGNGDPIGDPIYSEMLDADDSIFIS